MKIKINVSIGSKELRDVLEKGFSVEEVVVFSVKGFSVEEVVVFSVDDIVVGAGVVNSLTLSNQFITVS